MDYDNTIPAEGNALRGVSGDIAKMQENFDRLGSLLSGTTAPAAGVPATGFVVTSGAHTFGFAFSGVSGEVEYDGTPVLTTSGDEMLFAIPAGGSAAPTGPAHYIRQQDILSPSGLVESLGGHVVTLASGSIFVLDERAMYAYDIKEFHAQTASGTIDVTAKIGATIVSGLSGVTVSGTQNSTDTTAAYSVTSGDRVTLELGADVGTPSDLTFTFKLVRT